MQGSSDGARERMLRPDAFYGALRVADFEAPDVGLWELNAEAAKTLIGGIALDIRRGHQTAGVWPTCS